MNTRLAKNILEIIRNEKHLRVSLVADNSEVANDHWAFTDAPFLAELCLMLLVALRHQLEREFTELAARAADNGQEIDRQQYQKRVKELQNGKKWKTIHTRLRPESCNGYEAVEALRLLANCYKHDPAKQPDEELLKVLNLPTGVNYAPLPESDAVREGLAALIGLTPEADYCEIVEKFLDIIELHLADVQRQAQIGRVRWGRVSLNPRDFAR